MKVGWLHYCVSKFVRLDVKHLRDSLSLKFMSAREKLTKNQALVKVKKLREV